MIEKKLQHLIQLANQLEDANNEQIIAIKRKAESLNKWFTQAHIDFAFRTIIEVFLDAEKLTKWLAQYTINEQEVQKQKVGLILAGNIPLVGFHDILCLYILNIPTQIKCSSKDEILTRYIVDLLVKNDEEWKVEIVERLHDYTKVIATGSNNTNRYFEYYFKHVPALLRTNRNAIAILKGNESDEELTALADDIFMYFGQGCRNISKLFVPKDYDITKLFQFFKNYEHFHQHKLYMDNYDYTRTLFLMNQTPHFANEFLMLKEDDKLASRLATVHYSFYTSEKDIQTFILENEAQLQCIISKPNDKWKSFSFGEAQKPGLDDYADNIDTIQFLLG
jgi:hypothetical protein